MAQEKKHGGKRPNAGRNPVKDLKIPITIYIQQSIVDSVGGVEGAKALAVTAIERGSKKKK